MAIKQDIDIDLEIRFGNNMTKTRLKRKEPNESIAQLGVKNNPSLDFTDDVNDRLKTSKAVTTRLKQALLSSKNAFWLYRNIWLPKMQYPLAVTSLLKETCLQIMKSFVYAILSKMGFSQHIAREIIYGSTWFGRFQFAHLYNEQGYLALKYLLGHLRKKTITGNQIMIALSYAQLVAGSSEPYL
eukprot:5973073-Ditylum_brightwellii.AAC.1